MDANLRKGILSLSISDEDTLYKSYMPFLKNGGIFIPTNKTYKLGAEIFLLLTLMDEPEKLPVAGTIAWVTPKGAQGNQAAGIGVHFSTEDNSGLTTKHKIETYLVDRLKSDKITHTM